MAALTVLFAVVVLLLGGQTLFLDALRVGFLIALLTAATGAIHVIRNGLPVDRRFPRQDAAGLDGVRRRNEA